jgi:hypothetical protein
MDHLDVSIGDQRLSVDVRTALPPAGGSAIVSEAGGVLKRTVRTDMGEMVTYTVSFREQPEGVWIEVDPFLNYTHSLPTTTTSALHGTVFQYDRHILFSPPCTVAFRVSFTIDGTKESIDQWTIRAPGASPLTCFASEGREVRPGWLELDLSGIGLNGTSLQPPLGVLRAPFVKVCVNGAGGVVLSLLSSARKPGALIAHREGRNLVLSIAHQELVLRFRNDLTPGTESSLIWVSPLDYAKDCAAGPFVESSQPVTLEGTMSLR